MKDVTRSPRARRVAGVSRRIVWYARGGGIAKCGPFCSQVDACEAMRLVDGGFPDDVFVWPERKEPT